MAEADLSKIVNMILENPELVEKIKSMAENSGESPAEEAVAATPVAEAPRAGHSKRNELLHALRAFVSPQRQRSLDTMMTIASVLDTMKTR